MASHVVPQISAVIAYKRILVNLYHHPEIKSPDIFLLFTVPASKLLSITVLNIKVKQKKRNPLLLKENVTETAAQIFVAISAYTNFYHDRLPLLC